MDRKNLDALLKNIDNIRKDLIKLRDKGGLVVIEAQDTQITTYNLNSYRR